MLNRNIFFPSLIILLSLIFLVFISQFPEPRYQDAPVGAGFFPAVIAVLQIIICSVLIFQYKQKQNNQQADKQKQQETNEIPLVSKHSIFGFTLLIGYAALITLVGYLPASLVGFTYYLVYYRVKKPLYYAIAWIFVFTIYFLFGEVFVISLPEGLLFF
ncbi:tripartite tricarboxylate transporter TctB family protein [Vibrio sp. 1-Bac 57]|uniref:tripartite tricarboxylate transporter TctB family protein n=1 Tax=Psychromonas sp. SA13A TaxID=2686346 RepID=UPI00140B999A|nr:tripartite tricarboxylate transporter TctB family protein [Psychromonas sp. SA13A]